MAAAAALVTGLPYPRGGVFALTLSGCWVGWPRWRWRVGAGSAGPGPAVAGLALVGIAACVSSTTYYLAAYPSTHRVDPPTTSATLPPVTAVVLAVVLAGCLWLVLTPPRWLLPDRHARRFGVAMAIALVAGFVLVSRLEQHNMTLDAGIMSYLLYGPILVVLTGSAAAGAAGRSFRSGLWACAWAVVLGAPLLIAVWLAEALPPTGPRARRSGLRTLNAVTSLRPQRPRVKIAAG